MVSEAVGRSSMRGSSGAGEPGATGTLAAARARAATPTADRAARAAVAGDAALNPDGGARARLRGVEGAVLSRQAARSLSYISERPGSSRGEVQAALAIRHASQASKLLGRLSRNGLIATGRGRSACLAWAITERGRAVLSGRPEGVYA